MTEVAAETLAECDLVMKGGVTSGVVYPYAILELSKAYRFRSIGGASAGAIAAAFAAAAEYARRKGDPDAFERFKSRCDEIPGILGGLFQASAPFARLMNAALAATGEKRGRMGRVLKALRAPLMSGASAGALAFAVVAALPLLLSWSLGAGLVTLLGMILAAAVGAVGLLVFYVARLILRDLPAHNFGLCSGFAPSGATPPVLTTWIYEALQFIAFGPRGRLEPLTFRDLATVGLSEAEVAAQVKAIDLRMMTTNLSLGRPHALPDFGLELLFDPIKWRRLFPADVMTYLESEVCPQDARTPSLREAPDGADLPVIVAVRMSLSFPFLIEAVPMAMYDIGAAARDEVPKGDAPPLRGVLFSDGGITSNFPIHFFDSLLPTRPTFALSLDEMHSPGLERISMPQAAKDGAFSPIRTFAGTLGFGSAVLGAAKDWQDEMRSVLPGYRQRVVRIRLEAGEGGLNLNMEASRSRRLMGYGAEAGARICSSFNFPEHRYRRTIVAYEHVRDLAKGVCEVWPSYGPWYQAYAPHAQGYNTMVRMPARREIGAQLAKFAKDADVFAPLPGVIRFPQPKGKLGISPQV